MIKLATKSRLQRIGRLVLSCLIALTLGACARKAVVVAPPLKDELGPYNTVYLANSMPLCSSLAPESCSDPNIYPAVKYQITAQAISAIQSWPAWSAPRAPIKTILISVLEQALGINSERSITKSELDALFSPVVEKQSGITLGEALSEDERALINLHLAPSVFRDRQVMLAKSANADSRTVYKDFVETAAKLTRNSENEPLIAVISSGSVHPMAAGDYYSQVLKQAGAKVVWLPIDPVFNRLSSSNQCQDFPQAYARYYGIEENFPEHYEAMAEKQMFYCRQRAILLSLLHSANAIYFTGEQSQPLLSSLYDAKGEENAYYRLIRRRLLSGTLVLGGANPALLTLAYTGREMRAAALIEDYSGMNFFHDKGKEREALKCADQEHCLKILGSRRASTNNTRQVKERGLIFSRHLDLNVSMASMLRNMINEERDFGIAMMRNSAVLLSHPNFGRITLKNLTQSPVLVIDNLEADLDISRRRVEIENGLLHLLRQNDSFTYSYVSKNMFVTLSGIADEQNNSATESNMDLPDINKKNAMMKWINRFATSTLSDVEYQDTRVDLSLSKTSAFNLLFQTEGKRPKYSNLEYNVRFDKK